VLIYGREILCLLLVFERPADFIVQVGAQDDNGNSSIHGLLWVVVGVVW